MVGRRQEQENVRGELNVTQDKEDKASKKKGRTLTKKERHLGKRGGEMAAKRKKCSRSIRKLMARPKSKEKKARGEGKERKRKGREGKGREGKEDELEGGRWRGRKGSNRGNRVQSTKERRGRRDG